MWGTRTVQIRSRQQLSTAFCPRSQNYTEAQGFFRSSVLGPSHVPPRLLCHPVFSPRDSANSDAETLLITENFNQKLVAFILEALWTQLWLEARCFLLFPTSTVASHPTDLSTLGRPDQTGKSLYCRSLAHMEASMQAPSSAFISSRETHSATKYSMLSICDPSTML